jgi:hypothetical protein
MAVWQDTARRASDVQFLELETRCRKCEPCLRARSAYWRKRAEAELHHTAGRTWFLTLTLAPQAHFESVLRASLRLAASGQDFDALSPAQQFAERHREVSREITRYLKRIRKESASPMRFLLVAEAHKTGLPHYHALIHEVDPDRPVRSRILRQQWTLGFSHCKLVAQCDETKSASYVAKYLAKSAAARVRASQGYGQNAVPDALRHRSGKTSPDEVPSSSPEEASFDFLKENQKLLFLKEKQIRNTQRRDDPPDPTPDDATNHKATMNSGLPEQ